MHRYFRSICYIGRLLIAFMLIRFFQTVSLVNRSIIFVREDLTELHPDKYALFAFHFVAVRFYTHGFWILAFSKPEWNFSTSWRTTRSEWFAKQIVACSSSQKNISREFSRKFFRSVVNLLSWKLLTMAWMRDLCIRHELIHGTLLSESISTLRLYFGTQWLW